jgi:predicted kinase
VNVLNLPGRTLLLVAGMPGAGKSTLLAGLAARPGQVVIDSDDHRAALRHVLPGVPYGCYRPLVHLWHRFAVLAGACSAASTVVVHLPATDPATRATVARLAALTGRTAHLLWLHVDAEEARRGQHERGRVVPDASFAAHAERAAETASELREATPAGWSGVTVLDREAAGRGLRIDVRSARPASGDVARRTEQAPDRRAIRAVRPPK